MSNVRVETKLWVWQRLSAAVLAVCVIIHLIVIVYAVQDGLTAEEIITRVSGNFLWLGFYSVFVIAIAVHAPIGVRTILKEMTSISPRATHMIMATFSIVILAMGFRAVIGLFSASIIG